MMSHSTPDNENHFTTDSIPLGYHHSIPTLDSGTLASKGERTAMTNFPPNPWIRLLLTTVCIYKLHLLIYILSVNRSETTASNVKTYSKELDFEDDKVETHGNDDGSNQPEVPPRTHHSQ